MRQSGVYSLALVCFEAEPMMPPKPPGSHSSSLLRSAKIVASPRAALALERLEDRTLLTGSVQLSNCVLLITGTGNDAVLVKEISGANKNQPPQVSVTLDGQTSTFKVTFVNQIQAQLGGGNDTFTLDNST